MSGYLKGDANPLTYSITSDVKKQQQQQQKYEQRNKQNKTTNTP